MPAAVPVVAAEAPRAGAAARSPAWRPILPEVSAAEVPRTLRQARNALDGGMLERSGGPGPGALELFLAVLAVAPDNDEARRGLNDCLDALLERGGIALRGGDIAAARRIEAIAQQTQATHPDLPALRRHLLVAQRAERLLEQGERAARQGHLLLPSGGSAWDFFRRARLAAPDYQPVERALAYWHGHLLQRAWKAASDENYAAAASFLAQARRWTPQSPQNAVMALRIVELRQALTDALLQQGHAAVRKLDLARAQASLAHARRVAAQPAGTAALQAEIERMRYYGPFRPGQVFADALAAGGTGPELVVIAHGRFRMGSGESEAGRAAHEGPPHEVRFSRGFALARREVSVGEFRRFVAASAYRTVAESAGRSRVFDERGGQLVVRAGVNWRHDAHGDRAAGDLPVLHVAFADAEAYAGWLSRQTGQRYRLPSEAEFEYGLRAGSTTRFPWGSGAPAQPLGNLAGALDPAPGRRWSNAVAGYRDGFRGPAPRGSFPAEGFSTFDLIGNVAEWTQDCWHDSYRRAPADGSAWVNPGCRRRVLRGAAWDSALDQARSAYRRAEDVGEGSARIGFRVVREL